MKNLNPVFGLLLITGLIIPFYSCQSQIKINSAEQVADALALQMNSPNERVKSEWAKSINFFNQRNVMAEELIKVIDKSTNGATTETKELAACLKKFKSLNQSDELLISEELFNAFTMQIKDLTQKISKVFILADMNKINNSSYQNIKMEMEGLENRISIQRRRYNEEAESYNNKIKKDANSKFFDKYPNLGTKCYFKSDEGAGKAPEIPF